MAQKFLTDIELTRGLKDSSGDLGTSGQVLSSTGSALNWIDNTASASVVYQDGFTGDGSTTAFTLANSIDNENKTQVYIDGVYQHKDTYSLSGTTLTFSTAPPNTSDIEVISFKTVTADGDILTDSEFSSAGLMKTNGSGVYSIVTDNSTNWNTAYTYSQVGHLPLAGGTLTGGLTGTTATFSASVIANGNSNSFGNTTVGALTASSISSSGSLSITGNTNSIGATTFTNGITLSGGSIGQAKAVLHTNNVIYFRGGSGGLFLQNADGSDGYYISNTDHKWEVNSGESMRLTSTGLGIGTTSPSHSLHVVSAGNGEIKAERTSGTAILTQAQSALGRFGTTTNHNLQFMANSNGWMTITTAGNVGIGITSPGSKFEVYGGTSGTNDIDRYARFKASNGEKRFDFHIGGTGNASRLDMYQADGTTIGAKINSGGDSFLLNNLGIGITSPQFKLHVVGASATEATVARFAKGNYADSGGHTTIIGLGAENTASWTKAALAFERTGSYDRGKIHFLQENTTNTTTAALSNSVMTIDSSGLVSLTESLQIADTKNLQFINSSGDHARITYTQGNGTTGDNWGLTFYQNSGSAAAIDFFASSEAAGDGNIRFNTAGNERMRVTSGGEVKIASSGDGNKLTVQSSHTNNHNIIEIGQTGSDGFLDVSDANGVIVTHLSGYTGYASYFTSNVGIGTTSPAQKLEVVNSGFAYIRTRSTAGSFTGFDIGQHTGGGIFLNNRDNTAITLMTNNTTHVTFNADRTTTFAGNVHADVINNAANSANIIYRSGTSTLVGGGSSGNKLYVLDNGNVGIGATNPGAKLDVGGDLRVGNVGSTSSTTNHETVLRVKGKNNYSDGTTWYGDYGQIILHADTNMTGSARRYMITSALNNNKFAIVRSVDGNTDPLVNSTSGGDAVNSGTADFVIDNSGRIGIGTTAPSQKLHVKGDSAILYTEATGSNQNSSIWFRSNVGGTVADRFEIGTNIGNGADLEIYSRQDSATRFLIESGTGNVGIGTTGPGYKLHVYGDFHAAGAAYLTATNSSYTNDGLYNSNARPSVVNTPGGQKILFGYFDNGAGGYFPRIGFRQDYNSVNSPNTTSAKTSLGLESDGRMSFKVGASNAVEALSIKPAGYVGIGTTSPAYKLHISEATDRSLSSSQAQMRIEGNGYGAFFALNNDSFQIGQNSNHRDLTFHSGASSASILERMRIKSHGDVCIGGTSTQTARTASFDVGTNNIVFDNCTTSGAGNGAEYQTFRRHNGSNAVQIGSIVMNGTSGVTYATSSDYRLKENVVELTNALDRVDQLKPSRFNFISDEGRTIDGFLAHEVSDIVPEAIVGTKDEVDEDGNPKYQSIDQSKLVPLLVGAIKELKAEIEQLKTQINN